MPTATYDLISNTTLSSAQASVTISSISGSYRDLVLVVEGVASSGDFYPRLRFNSDTGNNYNFVNAGGDGVSTSSNFGSPENGLQIGNIVFFATSNRTFVTAQIFDYSATDKHKVTLSRASRQNRGVEMLASRWASTSAITSIQLYSGNGNTLAAGTTVRLFGIVS